jgi:hypothetical protein
MNYYFNQNLINIDNDNNLMEPLIIDQEENIISSFRSNKISNLSLIHNSKVEEKKGMIELN